MGAPAPLLSVKAATSAATRPAARAKKPMTPMPVPLMGAANVSGAYVNIRLTTVFWKKEATHVHAIMSPCDRAVAYRNSITPASPDARAPVFLRPKYSVSMRKAAAMGPGMEQRAV